MDYGGNYRNTPEKLVQQAQAEDLGIVFNLIVNKEERVPDIAYFSTRLDPASTPMTLLSQGQEFHTSYWGHLGLLHPGRNFLIPGYAGYPGTAAASLYPTNAAVADMGHAEGALVGYVHPFEAIPDPAHDKNLTSELPVDVALGKVDYIEILGFSDHKSTAAVWYRSVELWLSSAGRSRHGRDDELRLTTRSFGPQSSLCCSLPSAATAQSMAGKLKKRTDLYNERASLEISARKSRDWRADQVACGIKSTGFLRIPSIYCPNRSP